MNNNEQPNFEIAANFPKSGNWTKNNPTRRLVGAVGGTFLALAVAFGGGAALSQFPSSFSQPNPAQQTTQASIQGADTAPTPATTTSTNAVVSVPTLPSTTTAPSPAPSTTTAPSPTPSTTTAPGATPSTNNRVTTTPGTNSGAAAVPNKNTGVAAVPNTNNGAGAISGANNRSQPGDKGGPKVGPVPPQPRR